MKLTKTEAFLIEILRAADKPLSQAELHAALYAGIPEPPQVNNACVQVYRLNKNYVTPESTRKFTTAAAGIMSRLMMSNASSTE